MKQDTERNVTIEDLLRLKRSERPQPESWATFESELRAKQLAAIVGKRSWWDGLARVLTPSYRYSVSAGAVAALALAWVGIRHSGTVLGSSAVVSMGSAQHASGALSSKASPAPAAVAEVEAAPRSPVAAQAETHAPAHEAAAPVVADATVSHVMPAPASFQPVPSAREPFAGGIQVTLADFRATAPIEAQHDVFSSDREFEATVSPGRQPGAEPLARMDPSAERRARLLAPALPAYSASASGSTQRDWMRERAGEDHRYESMDLYSSNDRAVVGFRF